jgi:hypothetical protein
MYRYKVDAESIELTESIDQLAQRTGEAIVAVYQYCVESPPASISQEPVQSRPRLFGATNCGVDVFLDFGSLVWPTCGS